MFGMTGKVVVYVHVKNVDVLTELFHRAVGESQHVAMGDVVFRR